MLMTRDGCFALMFNVGCALGPSRSVSADANGGAAGRNDVAICGRAG